MSDALHASWLLGPESSGWTGDRAPDRVARASARRRTESGLGACLTGSRAALRDSALASRHLRGVTQTAYPARRLARGIFALDDKSYRWTRSTKPRTLCPWSRSARQTPPNGRGGALQPGDRTAERPRRWRGSWALRASQARFPPWRRPAQALRLPPTRSMAPVKSEPAPNIRIQRRSCYMKATRPVCQALDSILGARCNLLRNFSDRHSFLLSPVIWDALPGTARLPAESKSEHFYSMR